MGNVPKMDHNIRGAQKKTFFCQKFRVKLFDLSYFCNLIFGMWRSPVAYTAGGRVVAGSNPVIPTKQKSDLHKQITFFVSHGAKHSLGERGKQKKYEGAGLHFSIFSEGLLGLSKPYSPN